MENFHSQPSKYSGGTFIGFTKMLGFISLVKAPKYKIFTGSQTNSFLPACFIEIASGDSYLLRWRGKWRLD